MSDTAQLREALEMGPWNRNEWMERIENAAREFLTIREAGALIIVPDENGKWPNWALTQLGFGLDPEATLGHLLAASRTAQEIDASGLRQTGGTE